VKKAFNAVFLAAGLAGCGATPMEVRNEKEVPLPPGEGAFGSTMTWEWRRKDTIPPESTTAAPAAAATASAAAAPARPAQATAAEQDEFKKWRESASGPERQEFEDWRAWQEWKRKNPK
jgi:hypothetical protein